MRVLIFLLAWRGSHCVVIRDQSGKKTGSLDQEKGNGETEYDFDGDFVVNGKPLLIDQPASGVSHNYGRRVWGAGVYMAEFLPKLIASGDLPAHPRGLEYGSGTGVGGIAFAMAGGNVTLTDKDKVEGEDMPLDDNLKRNSEAIAAAGGAGTVKPFDWAVLPPNFSAEGLDVIFGADLFGWWRTDPDGPQDCPHCPKLVKAIAWAHEASPAAKIFFAYSKKYTDEKSLRVFVEELQKNKLKLLKHEHGTGTYKDTTGMLTIGPL